MGVAHRKPGGLQPATPQTWCPLQQPGSGGFPGVGGCPLWKDIGCTWASTIAQSICTLWLDSPAPPVLLRLLGSTGHNIPAAAHPPGPPREGLAARPTGGPNHSLSERASVSGQRQPRGAYPSCLHGPSPPQDGHGKPPFLPSCTDGTHQPHPSWPGEGASSGPAEDQAGNFSRNKRKECSNRPFQPLFQANFHIIESNDFLSFLLAPLHNLTNCRKRFDSGAQLEGLAVSDKWQGSGVRRRRRAPKVPAASTVGKRTSPGSPRGCSVSTPSPAHTPGDGGSVGRGGGASHSRHRFCWQAGPSASAPACVPTQCVLQGLPGRLAQSWAWR